MPTGAVLSNEETFSDPHIAARAFYQHLHHPVAGDHPYPGFLWQLDRTPMQVRRPPNTLGQHNREIYGGLLGLNDAELSDLEALQVIGDTYAPNAGQ